MINNFCTVNAGAQRRGDPEAVGTAGIPDCFASLAMTDCRCVN